MSGTFSNYVETHFLDNVTGKVTTTIAVTPVFLALCTVVPDSSKTGATITEATYTGYARASLNAAAWNSASSGGAGAASSVSNAGTITFAACTAGSSTIIGWALLDSGTTGAGNMLAWGSATSTVISTTQTPPTVSAAGLNITLI